MTGVTTKPVVEVNKSAAPLPFEGSARVRLATLGLGIAGNKSGKRRCSSANKAALETAIKLSARAAPLSDAAVALRPARTIGSKRQGYRPRGNHPSKRFVAGH